MKLDPVPTLIVDRAPYTLVPGDRIIFDSRNGTMFVHNVGDDDVYFRVGDHVISRHFVAKEITKDQGREVAEQLAKHAQLKGEVKEVEGSFPTLFTFLIVA